MYHYFHATDLIERIIRLRQESAAISSETVTILGKTRLLLHLLQRQSHARSVRSGTQQISFWFYVLQENSVSAWQSCLILQLNLTCPFYLSPVQHKYHTKIDDLIEKAMNSMRVALVAKLISVLEGVLSKLGRFDEGNLIGSFLTFTVRTLALPLFRQ